MDMDKIKAMAAIAALGALGDNGGGKLPDFPKFNNEETALAHAKLIAQIKPGDEVRFKSTDEDEERAIFLGNTNDGRKALLLRYDEEQEISMASIPWGSIRL